MDEYWCAEGIVEGTRGGVVPQRSTPAFDWHQKTVVLMSASPVAFVSPR